MKMIFKALFLCLISICNSLAGVADLSIELEFNTTNGVVLEPQGEFSARIRNNGPDIAGVDSTLQFPISFSSGIIRTEPSVGLPIEFAPSINNNSNCFFTTIIGSPIPDGTVSYVFVFNVPSLAVNESIECLGIYTTNFLSGTREVNWEIRNSFDEDPNLDNNSQTITFGVPPRSVPANNPYFLIVLLVLVICLGNYSFKK